MLRVNRTESRTLAFTHTYTLTQTISRSRARALSLSLHTLVWQAELHAFLVEDKGIAEDKAVDFAAFSKLMNELERSLEHRHSKSHPTT